MADNSEENENKIVNQALNESTDSAASNNDIGKNESRDDSEYFVDKCHYFTLNISRYLTRCYDNYNKVTTEVVEEIDLPRDIMVMLRGSINRYKCTSYLDQFLQYADHEDRDNVLRREFTDILLRSGHTLSYNLFLRLAAVYILVAYDLKKVGGIDEAPDCVLDALTTGILCTHQWEMLKIW